MINSTKKSDRQHQNLLCLIQEVLKAHQMYITFRALFSYAISAVFVCKTNAQKTGKLYHISHTLNISSFIYIFFTVGIKIYAANNNKNPTTTKAYFLYKNCVCYICNVVYLSHISHFAYSAVQNNNNNNNDKKNRTEIFIYM